MTTEKINKIRAEYIIENMNSGLSFELALEKSFNQINEFLNSLMNNEDFNELVFNNMKKIKKMREQKLAIFLLEIGFDKKEIVHFINRCRQIPMVGSIHHIKGLSNRFYLFLSEVIRNHNMKNNYTIDGVCLRKYIIDTFDL